MENAQLSFSDIDQDRIILEAINNSKFLAKLKRKRLEPKLFSSDIRQKVVTMIYRYHDKYGKAPAEHFFSVLEEELSFKDEKEHTEYLDYSNKIYSMDTGFDDRYLLDKLDDFLKKRIIATAFNSLYKIKDSFELHADKAYSILKDAVDSFQSTIGRQVVSKITDDVNYDYYSEPVTKFGLKELDEYLDGGIFPGQFVVIQGYTNIGKSWCIQHLARMATRYGYNPLLIVIEMSQKTLSLRLKMSIAGMTKQELINSPNQARTAIAESLVKKSNIFTLNDEEKSISIDALPSIVAEMADENGIEPDLILIDSADDTLPLMGRKYLKDTERLHDIYTYLKNYAKDSNKCIITSTQTQRIGPTKKWVSSSNVGGFIGKMQRATLGISLNATNYEYTQGLLRIEISKATDGKVGGRFWVRNDFKTGQFITEGGLYNESEYEEMTGID